MAGDPDPVVVLAMELVTASFGDEAEYYEYVGRRLREEQLSAAEVVELVVILASFGGNAVNQWAEDTDRAPGEILHNIGLDLATGGNDDG